MRRKIIPIILCFAMICTMIPVMAFAAHYTSSNSSSGVNAGDLQKGDIIDNGVVINDSGNNSTFKVGTDEKRDTNPADSSELNKWTADKNYIVDTVGETGGKNILTFKEYVSSYTFQTAVDTAKTSDKNPSTDGTQVFVGDKVYINVIVSGTEITKLKAVDFVLNWNKESFELSGEGIPAGVMLDKDGGSLRYLMTYPKDAPISDDGKILSLTFNAKAQTAAGEFYVTNAYADDIAGVMAMGDTPPANISSDKAAVAVVPFTSTITLQNKEVTYDGNQQKIDAAVVTIPGMTEPFTDDGNKIKYIYYSTLEAAEADTDGTATSLTEVKKPGTYGVRAILMASGSYDSAVSNAVTLKINDGIMSFPLKVTVKGEYIYSGEEQTPVVETETQALTDESVVYKYKKHTTDTDVKNDALYTANAGVMPTFMGSANEEKTYKIDYMAKAENYAPVYGTFEFTIKPAKYEIELKNDFIAGHSLILVYTDSEIKFKYKADSTSEVNMYELDTAYKYNDISSYKHVYGYLVKSETGLNIADVKNNIVLTTEEALKLCKGSTFDVNGSDSIDPRDIATALCVYNVTEVDGFTATNMMDVALKCDVNHDKKVNVIDMGLIKYGYLNK